MRFALTLLLPTPPRPTGPPFPAYMPTTADPSLNFPSPSSPPFFFFFISPPLSSDVLCAPYLSRLKKSPSSLLWLTPLFPSRPFACDIPQSIHRSVFVPYVSSHSPLPYPSSGHDRTCQHFCTQSRYLLSRVPLCRELFPCPSPPLT